MQKLVFILCGLPGSGKSTWRERFVAEFGPNEMPYTVSTDDFVGERAKQLNQTYAETWLQMREQLEPMLMAQMCKASNYDIIIVDSTNLTARKRFRIRRLFGDDYKYVIVDFTEVSMSTIMMRNAARRAHGRDLPEQVIYRMAEIMEPPYSAWDERAIVLENGAVSSVYVTQQGSLTKDSRADAGEIYIHD